jgi:hypothetical protein
MRILPPVEEENRRINRVDRQALQQSNSQPLLSYATTLRSRPKSVTHLEPSGRPKSVASPSNFRDRASIGRIRFRNRWQGSREASCCRRQTPARAAIQHL